MDFIQKTGLSQGGKLFKYVVSIICISRLETIHQQVANLKKFGFTEDETFSAISPYLDSISR
ncbi:hypothetical protein Csa_004365 [Cucumis sativus]|uniref:Uncharacterized protein n=2 Tax=Cucumis sativus TaxID=3659 RepID=A0A0A0KL55_CUCSA|nr:hypothetical protein Csa_004365 [Cucumis sativus]